jgi:hypothetical protein
MKVQLKIVIAASCSAVVLGLVVGTLGYLNGAKKTIILTGSGFHTYNVDAVQKVNAMLTPFENIKCDLSDINVSLVPSDHYGI